ncbi:autorepressor SdpR family transcription factor [Sporosalibacterium faouarense]|uniref:autorepressor SdpR family transcription factor n=1 Tax=Sporosalibacterium faouarense TaxID=516123 RepID=UPI00141D1F98|nr:autorepressor SdpR family transcription factor [Sporosalibacterium faouarense]MTI47058.1 winged helix-turn-helix transcriptional regulator [Bacillota bacterium]
MNKAFKALSDPTRRKILELLKDNDLTAGEISECFNISKPSISHHLNILSNAELVLRDKQGQHVIYSLNTTALQDILKWTFDFVEGGNKNENKN